jgi:hypothetical protein
MMTDCGQCFRRVRPTRSNPEFSITVISGCESQQIKPGDKRAVALWCPSDVSDLGAVPALPNKTRIPNASNMVVKRLQSSAQGTRTIWVEPSS